MQPIKEAKTQLIAFDASAFPYAGTVPETNKPFLDVRQGKRRGHTTSRGDVYWEDPTYHDRRSLLHLPAGYTAALPGLIVLFLHGQGATLERDVLARQGIARQVDESGQNVALVAPQLALDALDSSAGNFWRPGHFARYIDEAAERLMRLYGDRRAGPHFNASPVRAGGLQRRLPVGGLRAGARRRHLSGQGRDPDGRALWRGGQVRRLGRDAPPGRLPAERLHRLDARGERHPAGDAGEEAHSPTRTSLPRDLAPGTMTFLSCGGLEMHGDFMTKAWGPDPLAQALAMIPGYPQTVRAKKTS